MKHQLVINDLTVAYRMVPAIHHLTLVLSCGHRVALVGPNGAGKTTLFKALVGLVPIATGSVNFGGHGETAAAADLAYLPQRGAVDWDFPVTVRGLVEMGRYLRLSWWRPFAEEDARAVERALSTIGLEEVADRQISALSGGQQQRAFIARSLAQNAHVFLLDEPFNGLDQPAQELLGETIHQLADAGNLVITAHHDLKSVPALFDQVVFLNRELIAFGDTAEVFTEENIARAFNMPVPKEPGIF
jgi:manganese/iron transport system ATP-binding protein/manganese/zinc/iron transport system ATP- binding protein